MSYDRDFFDVFKTSVKVRLKIYNPRFFYVKQAANGIKMCSKMNQETWVALRTVDTQEGVYILLDILCREPPGGTGKGWAAHTVLLGVYDVGQQVLRVYPRVVVELLKMHIKTGIDPGEIKFIYERLMLSEEPELSRFLLRLHGFVFE